MISLLPVIQDGEARFANLCWTCRAKSGSFHERLYVGIPAHGVRAPRPVVELEPGCPAATPLPGVWRLWAAKFTQPLSASAAQRQRS